MSPAFALQNLRAQTATPCVPWEFTPSAPIHELLRTDKKQRVGWITNPMTQHQCYALVEGVNPGGRVSKSKGEDEGNPPHKIHGLAADYDGRQWELSDIQKAAEAAPCRPSWYERTLSGYVRLVWLFEAPVLVDSWDTGVEFLKLALGKVGASSLLPGLDKGSFDPGRYYTNSGEWYELPGGAPVSRNTTTGWLVELVRKLAKGPVSDITIPLEVVAPALAKRYPRFSEWPMDFVEGAQGPTFWVDGSTSPTSAIVKPGGIYTFSDHATKAFYSWSDLLGAAFTDAFRAERVGQLVADIYFEPTSGKYYFPTGVPGEWVLLSKENLILQLREARGASMKPDKEGSSEITRALAYIQIRGIVAGAGPFVYRPPGLIEENGTRILNTCTVKVVPPSGVPEVWGPDGRFPFISALLSSMFDEEALSHVLGWIKVAYESGYYQRPSPGQAIVLAGAIESGKSFIANRIIAELLGGGIDATRYIMGEDSFSAPYLARPCWLLDDMTPPNSETSHRLFTHFLKRVVANDVHVFNAKFLGQQRVYWCGRAIQTVNDDDESREALPSPNSSNADKLCYYRLRPAPQGIFSRDREENNARARAELPAFAQWLLDYKIPEKWLKGSVRMGIAPFHDPELRRAAEENGEASYLTEILVRWRGQYFDNAPELAEWVGTTTDLMRELMAYEIQGSTLISKLTPRRVAQQLRHLSASKSTVIRRGDEDNAYGFRTWVVPRPTKQRAKAPAAPEPVSVERFQDVPR